MYPWYRLNLLGPEFVQSEAWGGVGRSSRISDIDSLIRISRCCRPGSTRLYLMMPSCTRMQTEDSAPMLRPGRAVPVCGALRNSAKITTQKTKWCHGLLLLVTLCSFVASAAGQGVSWYQNEMEAFAFAQQTGRPVLLVFSGSDWCIPCIRFRRLILADSAFTDLLRDELVLLEADFPQRETLPKDLVEQNERLAEQYNPEGLFPHILLLRPDRTILAQLSYANQSPDEFMAMVRRYLPDDLPRHAQVKEFSTSALLMGCGFEFTVVDSDSARAHSLLQAGIREVKRIELLLSEWIDTTQTSRVNSEAGSIRWWWTQSCMTCCTGAHRFPV